MRALVLIAVVLSLAAGGCGSDDESGRESGTTGAQTTLAAADVEAAVSSDLQAGGGAGGGGVVDLDGEPPKSVVCFKDTGPVAWRCRLTPARGGEPVICIVEIEPTTRKVSQRNCGRIDN